MFTSSQADFTDYSRFDTLVVGELVVGELHKLGIFVEPIRHKFFSRKANYAKTLKYTFYLIFCFTRHTL